VKIDGTDINTSGDLFQLLANDQAGAKVAVNYYRDSNQQNTEVTLGASP
jgi:S1-C subfamily serine protease